jgi:DNA-binding transcriptional LysR family regulator
VLERKFEYLVALAKEGHFGRAASACLVSQPTLSAAIQQLEAELGVQIVKRGQRFQGFTEQGELVLAAAQRMAMECDRLRQNLRDRRNDFSGMLRIGVLGSVIPLLKTFTIPFRRCYPDVNLKVTILNSFDVRQAFEESSLDIAITYLDRALRRYNRTRVLYTEEYELLIRKGTAFSGRKSVSWEELGQLPLCLFPPESHIFGAREAALLNETLSKTSHIITSAVWMVIDHVRTGNWASVLPRPVRMMISDDDELEAVPLPTAGKPASVAIAIPNREPVSPVAQAFFEVATSEEALRTLRHLLQIANESVEDLDGKPRPKRGTKRRLAANAARPPVRGRRKSARSN